MIKIAVLGAGQWGMNLVKNFYQLGVLDAVADPSEIIVERLRNTYPKVNIFSNFHDLLHIDIDAVAIATPAETHYAVAKLFLENGKDVLIEKPMTLKSKDAEELVEIANENKRILMVGHLLMYQPAIEFIKEYLKNGSLGEIYSLHQTRVKLGRVRKAENVLWSFGPHDLAVMLYLIENKVQHIQCNALANIQDNIEDDVYIHLTFANKIKAHLHTSWLWPETERKLVVVGSEGMLVYNEILQTVTLHKKTINADLSNNDQGEVNIFKGEGQPLKIECGHFIDCIEQRMSPKSSGESGLEIIKILEEADRKLNKDIGGCFIHPTATVDQGASIGEGTKVWHYSHISGGSKIGKSCNLGQNVFVAKNAEIGNNVKIQNNVSVYEGVILEDYVFCGPSMVFTNVKTPRCEYPRNTSGDYLVTRVKKSASIGANATIVCGTTLGEYCLIGAGAVVTKDVPPNALMLGNPARISGWTCECGEVITFNGDQAICKNCNKEYLKIKDDQINKVK